MTTQLRDRIDAGLRAGALLLLGLLTASFWRWADRVDEVSVTMREGVDTLRKGQSVLLVKIAELEGRIGTEGAELRAQIMRQDQELTRVDKQQGRHTIRPWHDQAGSSLAVQRGELDRLRERIEKIEQE